MKSYKGKTIRRRADGRWWARYYNNGKQRCVYGRTQDECLKRLKEALRQQGKENKPTQRLTLGEWLDKWLTLYKVGKVRETTVQKIGYSIKHLKPLHNKELSKITAIELQEYFNAIEKPRAKEQVFVTLKDALTKAYKNKLIKENPFDVLEMPKHPKKQSRALTHDEEQRFIEACKTSKQGDLFLLCLYQGLRLGEALALTPDDVDFEKRQISITKAINGSDKLSKPKTESSIRVMPLFTKSISLLRQLPQNGRYFKYGRKIYQNSIMRLCKKIDLQNVSIHSLRHTFATRCSEQGVAVKVVQKWLGHSTLEMTLNVYTHVNAEFEAKEAAKIDTQIDTHTD